MYSQKKQRSKQTNLWRSRYYRPSYSLLKSVVGLYQVSPFGTVQRVYTNSMLRCTWQPLLPNLWTTVFSYYIWLQPQRRISSWSHFYAFPVRFVSWVYWKRDKRASRT